MNTSVTNHLLLGGALCALVACGGEKERSESSEHVASSAAGAPVTPAPGGRMIEIEMFSNEKGNYFEPSEITARQGDVLQFELKTGVHNVNFLPDSNPGKTGLPAPTPLLQLPDQTIEVAVTMGPGTYYFHCDPHAALGMKGHLTVTK